MRGMFKLALLPGGIALALMALIPALSRAGEPPPDIPALVEQVEQQRITDHIAAIDEPRSPFEEAQLHATTDYVHQQLDELGYAIQRDPVTFQGEWRGVEHDITSDNVTGIKPGTQCPDRIFVVGAHYDSVPDTPGADDDASGTAGMLEIARVLAGVDLPATVYFTGFTLEEPGLVGSRAMATGFEDAGAEVVGMFSLEMIGFTDPAIGSEFIVVIGSEESAPLLASVERAKAYVPELPIVTLTAAGRGETSPDTRRSDHAPFWDAGYQALLVTDTANFRNPNYHQPSDTLDTLDLPFATNVTKAMLATTVDYLTRDSDGDGTADVCVEPLLATATPAPGARETPAPAVTATTGTGVTLPDTGGGSSGAGGTLALLVALAGILLLGSAVVLWRRNA